MHSLTRVALKFFLPLLFIGLSASAEPNQSPSTTNRTEQENPELVWALKVEQLRTNCIQNRRRICGKILMILPEGVVVDSGYINLARTQINNSWLIPGTVPAERAKNIIEEKHPGAFCVGLVFVTDLPKSPHAKPRLYDYINLEAFPAGQFSYTSVGDIHRNVRKFSAKLTKAVEFALHEPPSNVGKPNSGPDTHP
ncbi:MAG TPA: hypothetical protein VFB72_17545 [Verrucomicrobiae bacterium]|nr:hypothetical protein [Verrucomicrobiae bacterium]